MSKDIYIAGPLFTEHEREFIEILAFSIKEKGFTTFIPHKDAGILKNYDDFDSRKSVFLKDIEAIKECKIIVAIINGSDIDSGTAVEIGIAFALEKTIIGIRTDIRIQINNMVWGVCSPIFNRVSDAIETLENLLKKK